MNVVDVFFLASLSMLVVFFAAVAVVEWRQARRSDHVTDAEVIQHPRSGHRIHPAA